MSPTERVADFILYYVLRVLDPSLPERFWVPPQIGIDMFGRKTRHQRTKDHYEAQLAAKDDELRILQRALNHEAVVVGRLRVKLSAFTEKVNADTQGSPE